MQIPKSTSYQVSLWAYYAPGAPKTQSYTALVSACIKEKLAGCDYGLTRYQLSTLVKWQPAGGTELADLVLFLKAHLPVVQINTSSRELWLAMSDQGDYMAWTTTQQYVIREWNYRGKGRRGSRIIPLVEFNRFSGGITTRKSCTSGLSRKSVFPCMICRTRNIRNLLPFC